MRQLLALVLVTIALTLIPSAQAADEARHVFVCQQVYEMRVSKLKSRFLFYSLPDTQLSYYGEVQKNGRYLFCGDELTGQKWHQFEISSSPGGLTPVDLRQGGKVRVKTEDFTIRVRRWTVKERFQELKLTYVAE